MPSSTVEAWRIALKEPRFRVHALLTAVALIMILVSLARFLEANEARPGVVLPDPLLALFRPVDITWLTFTLIYGCLFTAIYFFASDPKRLLMAIQGYVLLVLVRIVAMSLVPLEPPPAMISLKDPFVEFFGGMAKTLDKDLFFSGHTSTLFLLYLMTVRRIPKLVFLFCTLGVAVCVILQHAHYAIDVFAAFFFSYGAYRIVVKANDEQA